MRFSVAVPAVVIAGRAAWAQTSGAFSILSYNVAGLPEPLSGGDPVKNTPLISPRLNPYDIVNVQEDFAYHDELTGSITHSHQTSTTGNVPFGSGLNTFSGYALSDLQRITWEACWFNAGDCLTPKGFTAVRATISPGVTVDIYNLHAEAGDDDLDFAARKAGLQQLSRYIVQYSAGNAVVLFGDTNTRYYESRDNIRLLTESQDGPKLVDVWVQLVKGGNPPPTGSGKIECPFPGNPPADCELIDKVMYRSSPLVRLIPQAFINENAKFLTEEGGPLSDHYPVSVPFQWELNPSLRASPEAVGGAESSGDGKRFSDLDGLGVVGFDNLWSRGYITTLTLRRGHRLDAIMYSLNTSSGKETKRGGNGGGVSPTVKLDVGKQERFVNVQACEREVDGEVTVVYARFESSLGQVVEGGRREGMCKEWKAPGEGWGLVGFKGRAGSEVRRLEVVWGKVF